VIFVYAKGNNQRWLENQQDSDGDSNDGITRLVCQLWNTSYVANLNYTNGVRTLTSLSTELIAPSNFSGGEGANAGICMAVDVVVVWAGGLWFGGQDLRQS
jgi:hypothetical protein